MDRFLLWWIGSGFSENPRREDLKLKKLEWYCKLTYLDAFVIEYSHILTLGNSALLTYMFSNMDLKNSN